MARVGELDWTNLMKGDVGEPAHPLSGDLSSPPNKGGENITKEDLLKDADFILNGFQTLGIKQPSKKEFEKAISQLNPHCALTDEEWDKIERDWNNGMNNTFEKLKLAKVQEEPDNLEEWGKSKSFNDSIAREELLERNMHAKE